MGKINKKDVKHGLMSNEDGMACDLICDAICERMGWQGAGSGFTIPEGFGNAFGYVVERVQVDPHNPDDNVKISLVSSWGNEYGMLWFVNASIVDSFGVGLITDLLLREIHARYGVPFWFCMQRDGVDFDKIREACKVLANADGSRQSGQDEIDGAVADIKLAIGDAT